MELVDSMKEKSTYFKFHEKTKTGKLIFVKCIVNEIAIIKGKKYFDISVNGKYLRNVCYDGVDPVNMFISLSDEDIIDFITGTGHKNFNPMQIRVALVIGFNLFVDYWEDQCSKQ